MDKAHATTQVERWKPAPGYEGMYEVSDLGRARSVERVIHAKGTTRAPHTRTYGGKILTPHTNADGYLVVTFSRGNQAKQQRLHRLIAIAFLGPAPEGMECCHNNGNAGDSRLVNLRWDTRSNNQLDAVAHGTHTQASKTHCPRGHAYTPENLAPSSRPGGRQCATCLNYRGGVGRGANNRDKTHCKRGHEFTPENTRIVKGRHRVCRQCMAIHKQNFNARRMSA